MTVSMSEVRIPLSQTWLALRVYTREGETALQAPQPVFGACGLVEVLSDGICR